VDAKKQKAAKRSIKIVNSGVNAAVFIAVILLVAVSLYALWDSRQVTEAASNTQYAKYMPTPSGSSISFDQLQEINPEVNSWLNIYGTHIDYPVTQSKTDNQKYINTNAFGKEQLSGSLFLDFRNSIHYTDFNTLIYGHHMAGGAMFGDLGNFSEKSYFDAHPYGDLFYDGVHHGLEIFAVAHTDGYNMAVYAPAITDPAAKQKYLDYILSIAKLKRDIGVSTNDKIVVMSTCNADSTNGRDIVVARIDSTTFANTFGTVEPDSVGIASAVDTLQAIWNQFPQGTLVIVWPLFVLLLILILVIGNRRRKKKLEAAPESAESVESTESMPQTAENLMPDSRTKSQTDSVEQTHT
jgi:sortase B